MVYNVYKLIFLYIYMSFEINVCIQLLRYLLLPGLTREFRLFQFFSLNPVERLYKYLPLFMAS